MTKRVSNKQVLEAIHALTQAIAGTTPTAQADTPEQAATPAEPQDCVKLTPEYQNKWLSITQKRANDTGLNHILYARRNRAGITRLAYCVADAYTSLKDGGKIGAIALVKPE